MIRGGKDLFCNIKIVLLDPEAEMTKEMVKGHVSSLHLWGIRLGQS